MTQTYSIHPFCELVPEIDSEGFEDLVADIRQKGLLDPIVLFEGKIIDGRTRHRACKKAGTTPTFVDFASVCPAINEATTQEEKDAILINWVVSHNICRRHLNSSQRALLAAKIANLRPGQSKSDTVAKGLPAVTRDEAAAKAGVHPATVTLATRVLREAPEKVPDIEAGKTTVTAIANEIRANEQQKQKEESDSFAQAIIEGVYTGKAFRKKVGELAKLVDECAISGTVVDYVSTYVTIKHVESMLQIAAASPKLIQTHELEKRLAVLQKEEQELLEEIAVVFVFCQKTYHKWLDSLQKNAASNEEKGLLAKVEEQFAETWQQVQTDWDSIKKAQYHVFDPMKKTFDSQECIRKGEALVAAKLEEINNRA